MKQFTLAVLSAALILQPASAENLSEQEVNDRLDHGTLIALKLAVDESLKKGTWITNHCHKASAEATEQAFWRGVTAQVYDAVERRCNAGFDITYEMTLRTHKGPLISCNQWGKKHGGKWDNPESGLAYTPLSKPDPKAIVSFIGQITDADGDELTINNKDDNAFIKIARNTTKISANRVKIGSTIYGIGTVTGAQKVKLADGSATIVPVITASCVGPHEAVAQ